MNRDPLAGHEADDAYKPLFRTIVTALHGCGNVGSVLEAFAGTALPVYAGDAPAPRRPRP
ncbi:MAG: hypothetical protein JF629_06155 [Variovorax paradoxus]|nr:hypothetical protein [Variovorax paradoxus]